MAIWTIWTEWANRLRYLRQRARIDDDVAEYAGLPESGQEAIGQG